MEEQIDRAHVELHQMIKSVDNFATKISTLMNEALRIVGERLNKLDEKVKVLENAGHITEATRIEADPNQLDLPFENPTIEQSQEFINIIYPRPGLRGEQK